MPAAGHHIVIERIGRNHDRRAGRVEHGVEGLLDRTHERERGADERYAVERGVHATPEARVFVRNTDIAVALALGLLSTVGFQEKVVQFAVQSRLAAEGFDNGTRGRVMPFAEAGCEDGDDAHQATNEIVALASPSGAGEPLLAASKAARRSAMRCKSS